MGLVAPFRALAKKLGQITKDLFSATSCREICLFQVHLVCFLGGPTIPLNVINKIIACSNCKEKSYLRFKLMSLLDGILFTAKILTNLLYYYHSNCQFIGASISKVILFLMIIGIDMLSYPFHKFHQMKQLASILNCFNRFESIGLGNIDTIIIKLISLQPTIVTISSFLAFGCIQYLDFIDLKHSLKVHWENPTFRIVQILLLPIELWSVTWNIGFIALLGYNGIFVGFAAIYTASKTVYRLTKYNINTLNNQGQVLKI